ncbi:hypothetical protein CDAR_25861 [Caerostris darwini]|uniref:Uncharacterized protein n=1 Tax=Caerostris darwini TaxID=1538125 RepID=A0AAV4PG53_9ARAC|nr:hypothetical protein CDAR_25861 [Caerostris darwini]
MELKPQLSQWIYPTLKKLSEPDNLLGFAIQDLKGGPFSICIRKSFYIPPHMEKRHTCQAREGEECRHKPIYSRRFPGGMLSHRLGSLKKSYGKGDSLGKKPYSIFYFPLNCSEEGYGKAIQMSNEIFLQ